MTRHYSDLGSASDWLKQISHEARPIRSSTQIWVVTRHQYGISALISQTLGAIHSIKSSGNFGPKLNVSVRSNRKSFEKTGPPFEVDHFSRSDRLEFWLNGSRPLFCGETTGGVAKCRLFSQAMTAFEDGLSVSSVKTAKFPAY